MKKRGIQVFIAIMMVLCLLTPSFMLLSASNGDYVYVVKLVVTPKLSWIIHGHSQLYVATAFYSNGDYEPVTNFADWSSGNESIAEVIAKGLVEGVGVGTANITAKFGGEEDFGLLHVLPFLKSLAIEPDKAKISVGDPPQQFKAIGTLSNDKTADLTPEVTWSLHVTWSFYPTKTVAVLEGPGLVRGLSPGDVTIMAEHKKTGLVSFAYLEVKADHIAIEKFAEAERQARELKEQLGHVADQHYSAKDKIDPKNKPSGKVVIIKAIANSILAYEADILEQYAKLGQVDPPSNYTEIFQIRPRTLDPWLPEPTTSFDFAAINFINGELRVIEDMEALAFSLDRQASAYTDSEYSYYRLQLQAVLDYTTMLIADLTALATSSAEYYEEWVKWIEETWQLTITSEDLDAYQQKLATDGFSQEELQIFKEGLLATDVEIEQIKSAILSVDPMAEWEAIESALPGLDDVILSALPALNGLASEAERVLSLMEEEPGGPCFIATAAYGTPMAEEIEVLREFRDQYLLTNPVGEALVDFYYQISPPIAEFLNEHPVLKPVVRVGLVPAIAISTLAVNTTLAQKIAIVSLLALVSALLVIWLRKRTGKVKGNVN